MLCLLYLSVDKYKYKYKSVELGDQLSYLQSQFARPTFQSLLGTEDVDLAKWNIVQNYQDDYEFRILPAEFAQIGRSCQVDYRSKCFLLHINAFDELNAPQLNPLAGGQKDILLINQGSPSSAPSPSSPSSPSPSSPSSSPSPSSRAGKS